MSTIATCLFALAILHTFLASRIHSRASQYREDSLAFELCQFFGEVEIVFPFWGAILFLLMGIVSGADSAIHYSESLSFREPLFVFVIMVTSSTRPIQRFASRSIETVAKTLVFSRLIRLECATYLTALSLGPILGSFITEPAAMTIIAWLFRDRFFNESVSDRFKYLTLAVLFVNISIGGVLTPYAAPPVLMVASQWGWGFSEMFHLFGWKAALAVFINATFATLALRNEISLPEAQSGPSADGIPAWVTGIHLFVLAGIVWSHQHTVFFTGLFLLFLALFNITRRHHEDLKLRESLLVAAFLGGLVALGNLQDWWISPLISALDSTRLFLGTTALTAITDNAALTYLGSQVQGLSISARYALMAGAVSGGGLTVIANAPNPAGYSILRDRFSDSVIQPGRLLAFALIPTAIAMTCFWVFGQ